MPLPRSKGVVFSLAHTHPQRQVRPAQFPLPQAGGNAPSQFKEPHEGMRTGLKHLQRLSYP